MDRIIRPLLIALISGCQAAKMSKHVDKAFTVALTMLLMLLMLIPTSSCYSMGAPDAACNAMTPGHQQQAQKVGKLSYNLYYIWNNNW